MGKDPDPGEATAAQPPATEESSTEESSTGETSTGETSTEETSTEETSTEETSTRPRRPPMRLKLNCPRRLHPLGFNQLAYRCGS